MPIPVHTQKYWTDSGKCSSLLCLEALFIYRSIPLHVWNWTLNFQSYQIPFLLILCLIPDNCLRPPLSLLHSRHSLQRSSLNPEVQRPEAKYSDNIVNCSILWMRYWTTFCQVISTVICLTTTSCLYSFSWKDSGSGFLLTSQGCEESLHGGIMKLHKRFAIG